MAILHLKTGEQRIVKHKVTAVPTAKLTHGAVRFPTRHMVFFANRWCRVWQHSDGSRYITNAYPRSTVTHIPE